MMMMHDDDDDDDDNADADNNTDAGCGMVLCRSKLDRCASQLAYVHDEKTIR